MSAPGLPASEVYVFLCFLSNIIDHCMELRGIRESLNLKRYWLHGIWLQTQLYAGSLKSEG